MHLAYPPRKASNPPPYHAAPSRFTALRRSRVQTCALTACAIAALFFIVSALWGGKGSIPSGTPPVVIVTVLDPSYNKEYIKNIQENRIEYAKKHGYTTFFATAADYELNGAPSSWARIPAVRNALTKFPRSEYIWYLDQSALIMNPELTVENHIMEPRRLEGLIVKDQPIVPPDSVIKTYSSQKGANVDFVLTQDQEGLSQGSFVIRKGEWSKFFLDTWFDPLYRSYNFQRADTHALEHIVQWHPTILSKLALVPQNIMNAYTTDTGGHYKDGDFVIRFAGCDSGTERDCAREADRFSKQWQTVFNAQR